MGLKFVVELRRFVLSWIDPRDTSTLHRQVRKQHKYTYRLSGKGENVFFIFLPLFIFSGGVQGGYLEHEGLLGGGVFRVGGNWSRL